MEYKALYDAFSVMNSYSDDGYNLLSAEVLPKEKSVSKYYRVKLTFTKNGLIGFATELLRYAHEWEKNEGGHVRLFPVVPGENAVQNAGVYLTPESCETILAFSNSEKSIDELVNGRPFETSDITAAEAQELAKKCEQIMPALIQKFREEKITDTDKDICMEHTVNLTRPVRPDIASFEEDGNNFLDVGVLSDKGYDITKDCRVKLTFTKNGLIGFAAALLDYAYEWEVQERVRPPLKKRDGIIILDEHTDIGRGWHDHLYPCDTSLISRSSGVYIPPESEEIIMCFGNYKKTIDELKAKTQP
jgi:hypothetical protein